MNVDNNIYEFPDAKGIVVSGDIHGDYEKLVYKCCLQCQMTDTLIIVAGDCGFGFNKPGYYDAIYQKVSSRLAKANNWIVFIRGNHDNPAYFDGQQVNYERWKAVPDYSVIKACGHTILCVGGAISIDRTWRMYEQYIVEDKEKYGKLMPYVYWPDEAPMYDQTKLETISKDHSVDVVITHTAPSFCQEVQPILIQNWLVKDEDLLDDIKHERKVMDDIHSFLKENNHPLQHWFIGHFHYSWNSEIDGVRYNILEIMELKELI